jgi:hypothetical protein
VTLMVGVYTKMQDILSEILIVMAEVVNIVQDVMTILIICRRGLRPCKYGPVVQS